MVRAAVPGDRAGERPLIVAGFGKAEAERLDRAPATHLGGDRGDRTGIDPTTQKEPERHITDELLADRSLELLPSACAHSCASIESSGANDRSQYGMTRGLLPRLTVSRWPAGSFSIPAKIE